MSLLPIVKTIFWCCDQFRSAILTPVVEFMVILINGTPKVKPHILFVHLFITTVLADQWGRNLLN